MSVILDAEGNARTLPFFACLLVQPQSESAIVTPEQTAPDQALYKLNRNAVHPRDLVNMCVFALSFRPVGWKIIILNEKEEILWIGSMLPDHTIKQEYHGQTVMTRG